MIKKKVLIIVSLGLMAFIFLAAVIPAAATPRQMQAMYYTPTARPDGRIIYIVKEGDSCMSIALLNGITEQQLRLNNNLNDLNCVIQPGKELLIAVVTPEPEVTVTPTLTGPTPTLVAGGMAKVCVLLFDDRNGDGVREDAEAAIANGQASIADRVGVFSKTGSTIAVQESPGEWTPLCFEEVPDGEYNISMAIPEGYNPTTNLNYPLKVSAGDTVYIDFGAQLSSRAGSSSSSASEGGQKLPWLAVFGGLLILAGLGMAAYFIRISRK